MDKVLDRLRHDPALEFGSAAEILQSGRDALDRAVAALRRSSAGCRRPPAGVDEMSAYEAKDAVLGCYQPPAADGSHPGVHWLNTSAPETRTRYEYEALAFPRGDARPPPAVRPGPGAGGAARFRRFGYVTAFSEGLGPVHRAPGRRARPLSGDLGASACSRSTPGGPAGSVVDTGLHQLGWSQDQAVGYMLANSA